MWPKEKYQTDEAESHRVPYYLVPKEVDINHRQLTSAQN